jgi:hypothetical protein
MEKYKNHPICIERNSILPVKSNQKMNDYLKEIATLCHIDDDLTTHKARRTFASTVTLKNGVPIHIVKEMMGHQSVRQTEEYAITEQESIGKEMMQLKEKLEQTEKLNTDPSPVDLLQKLEKEISQIKKGQHKDKKKGALKEVNKIIKKLEFVRHLLKK